MRNLIGLLKLLRDTISGVLEVIAWVVIWGFRWAVLALALLCFALGMHFLVNHPYGLFPPGLRPLHLVRRSPGGSVIMAVSLWITGWFFIAHYRLLWAKARRRSPSHR